MRKTAKNIVIIVICIAIFICVFGLDLYYAKLDFDETNKENELLKMFRDYYNAKVASYAEENKTAEDIDIIFLGDSLTDGYDLNLYYPEYKTLNRGIGGDTTFGLEARLDVSCFDIESKVVIMLIGANNFDSMLDNYENILIKFKEKIPNRKVILLSLTAMGGNWGRNNTKAIQNNQTIKSLAKKYNYIYIDLFTPLLNVDTGSIYPEYTTDGGHFTPLGYSIVTAEIKPVLAEIL